MKRKLIIVSILVIILATLTTGTLAYFNATTIAHNVITSGGVDIELKEWANGDKTETFEDLEGVMPGATVTKIPEVKNAGANPVFVRVSVEKSIVLAGQGEVDLSLLRLDLNTKDWTEKDGYYYYKEILAPGETTEPLFTTVTFDVTMGNEYQNAKAYIDLEAQAVQSANNGTDPVKAEGWPAKSAT